jgi:hypothetical protein
METNENYIHEEIKSKLIWGNACYHAVQNPYSSCLLYKNIKITIYKTINLLQRVPRMMQSSFPGLDKNMLAGASSALPGEQLST